MAPWADIADARLLWASAPTNDDILQQLLDSAQEVCGEYAPELGTGDPVPARYKQAVVEQARDIWQNGERDGDVLGYDGEYAVRVRPLADSVKSLLRPKRGGVSFGYHPVEETTP